MTKIKQNIRENKRFVKFVKPIKRKHRVYYPKYPKYPRNSYPEIKS